MPVFDSRGARRRRPDRRGLGRTPAASARGTATSTPCTSRATLRPARSQPTGTWSGATLSPGGRDASARRRQRRLGDVRRDRRPDVGAEGRAVLHRRSTARGRNLAAETGEPLRLRRHPRGAAAAALDGEARTRVRIGGGPDDRQTRLLHRALPRPPAPQPGRRRRRPLPGLRRQDAHVASGYTPYQNFSLWDTYRPQNQLLELLAPRRRPRRRALGPRDRPRRRLAAALGAGQQRDEHHDRRPGDAVPGRGLVARAARRPRGGGVRAAASRTRPSARRPTRRYNGRSGQRTATRARLHRVRSRRRHGLRAQGRRQRLRAPGLGDAGVRRGRRVARADGHGARPHAPTPRCSPRAASGTATCGTPRSQHVPPAHGTTGTWLDAVRPRRGGATQFHEGGAYQYQWLVPQDPAGLVGADGRPGGDREAARRLLRLRRSCSPTRPAPRATTGSTQPYDYYGKPTYNPNNEPDLHAPYMYLGRGSRAKTATVVARGA